MNELIHEVVCVKQILWAFSTKHIQHRCHNTYMYTQTYGINAHTRTYSTCTVHAYTNNFICTCNINMSSGRHTCIENFIYCTCIYLYYHFLLIVCTCMYFHFFTCIYLSCIISAEILSCFDYHVSLYNSYNLLCFGVLDL